jgi:integrase
MMFKYGRTKGLLKQDIDYGGEFDRPSKKMLRAARNNRGDRCFTPEQIKALVKKAEPHMRAMILLAVNGGLGNTDLAMLTPDRFDLDNGWLNYPRRKTQIFRRIPLWKETVDAVREAIKARRQPKNPADAKLLFIGKLGSSYVSETGGHRVAHEFENLCAGAGVAGRAFYDLRRTFATIADNLARDKDAVKAIMGHVPESDDMLDLYRQGFFDDRLRSVASQVHDWLFGRPAAGKKTTPKKKSQPAQPRRHEETPLRVVG